MGKLFNLDNPFIRFMEHVADFFILNVLTILLSVPVITAGAALTAHHKVMQNLVMDEEKPVGKAYFQAFASNFKQATVLWLITLLAVGIIAVDIFLVYLYLDGIARMLYVLLAAVGVLALGTACYAFSMIARYENTLKEHLRNSFILVLAKLPKTLLMLVLWFLPLLMAIMSMALFVNCLAIWGTFGISLLIYAKAAILKPVFLQLEEESDEEDPCEEP